MWPFGKSIAQRAQEAIDSMNVFQGLGLRVSEQNGVLSVSGAVPNKNYLRAIEAAVGGVKGIKSVDTSGVIVAQQEVSDADIAKAEEEVRRATESSALAKKVLAALEANGELKDDPIDVLQKGTGVMLRGAVDSQHEFNLAVQLAQGAGAAEVDTSGLQIREGAKAKYAAEQKGYVNVPDEWYTVQPGDTLSEIALKFYGDGSRESYMKIAKANNIQDPDLIRVGQKLQIPR
ncbi:MAG TPA: LysM peptidoglycan-binding domain-containing protein [Meiothermus sp.]|jgi:nucleoid-associated protein YgaU|nr:LysM peptidoglycan-binding domain-containing protein [Meiothermus sp.]